LSKTLYAGVPYLLDILAIRRDGEIHVCNKDRQWFRFPRLRDLLSPPGLYDLTLVIAGEDAPAESFLLRLEWSGNSQTSFLTNAVRTPLAETKKKERTIQPEPEPAP